MDPVHVIIRRKKAAVKARDIIYGFKARPLPGDVRTAWAMLVAHYCGKGFMRYQEFLETAERMAGLGSEMEAEEGIFSAPLDRYLMTEFRGALEQRAKEIQEKEPERKEGFDAQVAYGKELQWAKEAALTGRCALCGSTMPTTCGCGIGTLTPDGAGGLRQQAME